LNCYSADNYVNAILPKLKKNALITDDEYNPRDFSFGKWFIAYVSVTHGERSTVTKVYLFTTEKKTKELIESSPVTPGNKVKHSDDIVQISRLIKTAQGSWWGYEWVESKDYSIRHTPNYYQSTIIDKIISYCQSSKNGMRRCVAFIDGEPGSQKSTIANLLCSKLDNSILCETFDPFLCGDSYTTMYNTHKRLNGERTLVLLVNEVDEMIRNIKTPSGGSVQNKYYVQVKNKTTWNNWLDEIDKYGYNVIVLMTSNTKYENILADDNSYLRQGRIHLRFRLDKNNLTEFDFP